MKINNQKGFGMVEVIIILIVLALLGTVGWYVWKKQNDKEKKGASTTSQQTNKDNPAAVEEKAPDATADWTTYTNTPGKFSFKHPKTWVFASNPDACTPGIVLFASTIEAVGKCASGSFGQMSVSSVDGDMRTNYELKAGTADDNGYIDITKSDVAIDGVPGVKYVGTASGQMGMGLPDGTKVTQYVVSMNGRTYIANYTQRSTYPDALADFDLLVTKTLQFIK